MNPGGIASKVPDPGKWSLRRRYFGLRWQSEARHRFSTRAAGSMKGFDAACGKAPSRFALPAQSILCPHLRAWP
jgi:hypothetical protein